MEKPAYQKLFTPFHVILGAVLTLVVFVVMSYLLLPFTFSEDPAIALFQSCLTAVPISATFWFACNMFMIVLLDQKKRKQAAE